MAVTTTNLGVITAYGDAVAAGYTGTKAEWQALMASYATVAEDANEAKNVAVSAKDTAVAKATEATTAAATANTAKDTATSKATEATTAANTATTKANEASASAQSIAQSASQIAQNTSDINELKEELEVTSSYNITWSQGGINNSGTAVSRTNRIRTDYITIENDSIFVEIPAGFKYAIHAYNSSKTRIGYIPSGSDIMTDRRATYKVSDSYDNAVYFRMWVAYTDDSNILPAEGANVTVAPYESVIDTLKSHVLKSVRILGVGNSYTRDSIRWLCNILKESGYEDVVVGHGYLGASTLAEQYASLDSSDSNHSAFEYWKYSNTKNAVKTSGKTLDEIFADEPWDIVVFQQQSDESGQYASYVSLSFDINDFIAYIAGKVSNPDLKFALMMPWSHADGYTSTKFAEYYNSDPRAMLDAIKTVIPQVADHMSQCDYVVNAGEAIDLGRQNSYLNALGDQMLRTDKNHLYYGIPSYMVGLVYALTLCDVNLNNVMWYPTATDEGQTGITTSGYLAYLAKQCAFTAVNGYALADDISELKEDFTTTASKEDMLKSFPTDTASGAVASFADGANVPVKTLIVDINPVQSGSGDPSPTNVRPISGWSEVNVSHSGADMTNPTVISIQLGQTVYGGKLDVLSGELVIDRAMVDLGTLNWNYSASDAEFYAAIPDIKPSTRNLVCDRYIVGGKGIDKSILCVTRVLRLYDSAYTSAATLKASLTNAYLVYEVATPLTIQLTPHEVTALLGSNNVWADSGDSEVTYRADPTLYIQRLTEPDADMVADANITSGQYFMVGNTLYKATANIASGGAITPNVNCTRKSLSEALNELNA